MSGHRISSSGIRLPLAAAVVAGLLAMGGGVASATAGTSPATPATPGNPAPWRHGEVPFRGTKAPAPGGAHPPASGPQASAADMSFQGGLDGVGVTTGAPRVYLVFYGSQWGTQGTNTAGDATFTGDPSHMAPDLEAFFKGLGTGSELWSGVMTQYCEGVAIGTVFCPTGSAVVGYPTGGAYAGIWEDNGVTAPSSPTANQLGVEAEKAAAHFGNTTAASNRDAQYFIMSPTHTTPDGFNTPFGQFCAWHDFTGDSGYLGAINTSGTGGPVAFANMPYVTDAGASCGADFVNSGTAGALDGVTIVGGHEYAETITDQFPAGGWVDSSGYENGDKCAWISSGQGASANLSLTTGTFAVQSTWANDFNGGAGGCEMSHPIVTSTPPNTVTVATVANQDTNKGTAVNLGVSATDSGGLSVTWSATGLPAGLSIASTGATTAAITGTPTTGGTSTVTVTASDSTGGSGPASFSWTVNAVTVKNPGNQSTAPNTAVSLSMTATDTSPSPTVQWSASGLPSGLGISATTGIISGTTGSSAPATNVIVTATDTGTGAFGSTSFTWTVAAPNTVTVNNPGVQSTKRRSSVHLQMTGTDSGGLALTWSATGLPSGLSISASTGLITGTANKLGTWTVTVTATDSTGAHGSARFSWSVHS